MLDTGRRRMAHADTNERSDLELLAAIQPAGLRRFTREEYERLVAQGWFQDEPVELLHGFVVRMSPQGPSHAHAVDRLTMALVPALVGRAIVRVQGPFAASPDSEPEPDVCVLPEGDYSRTHPSRALLAIEVAGSSLRQDRGVKKELYAAAGVPEYWIVNLTERVVEVHRRPAAEGYTEVTVHGREVALELLAFPDVKVPLSRVLPE